MVLVMSEAFVTVVLVMLVAEAIAMEPEGPVHRVYT